MPPWFLIFARKGKGHRWVVQALYPAIPLFLRSRQSSTRGQVILSGALDESALWLNIASLCSSSPSSLRSRSGTDSSTNGSYTAFRLRPRWAWSWTSKVKSDIVPDASVFVRFGFGSVLVCGSLVGMALALALYMRLALTGSSG